MDSLHEVIFGQPTTLVVGLLLLALPVGYLAWRRQRIGQGSLLAWLAPGGLVGLAGLLVLLSTLFPSDRKKINRLLQDAADDVRAGQWQQLGGLATDDFQWLIAGQPLTANREETLARAQASANPLNLQAVKLNDPQLTVNGPAATVKVRVTLVAGALGKAGRGETLWRFALARQPDGRWLMRQADLLELDGRPLSEQPWTP